MSKTIFDCSNVENSVDKLADKQSGFLLLYHLTKWASYCINKKIETKNGNGFSEEEETIMFDKILRLVRHVRSDLIRLDIKNFIFLGLCLKDYDVGGNAKFNDFLVSSILEIYKSIVQNVAIQLDKKRKAEKLESGEWRIIWKKIIDELVKEKFIQRPSNYESPKFVMKPDVQNYLELRRDVESLYRISSKIRGFKHDLKDTDLSLKEKNLALQRVFHVSGEYLKFTDTSPNLSVGVREFLIAHGIPVKFLTYFTDLLAHHQLFPLMDESSEQIEKVLDEGLLPVAEILEKKILDIENAYIRGIAEENYFNFYLESRGIHETDSLLAKSIMQLYNNHETKNSYIEMVYQNAIRMVSKGFSSQLTRNVTPRNPENFLIAFIMKHKRRMYEHLSDRVTSWNIDEKLQQYFENEETSLDCNHDSAMLMMALIRELSRDDPLLPFVRDILKSEYLEINITNDFGESVRLIEEVKKYVNLDEIGLNFARSSDVSLEEAYKLIEKNGISEASEELKMFIKDIYTLDEPARSLTPARYESLVRELKLGEAETDKLLSFSVNWKKKKAVNLLKQYVPPLKKLNEYIEGGNLELIDENFPAALPPVKVLYEERIREEVRVLNNLWNPDAVKSQIINVYSLLDIAQGKSKVITKPPLQDGEGVGDEAKRQKASPNNTQLDDKNPEISNFRNYLFHGDVLTSESQQKVLDIQIVTEMHDAMQELNVKLEQKELDMRRIEKVIDSIRSNVGKRRIKMVLCHAYFGRKIARDMGGCLTREDIEKVVKGDLEEIDLDTMKIDSEKLIYILSNDVEMNEEKFINYIALASETEIEGSMKNVVGGLIDHQKTYIRHLEKVGMFSGFAMHRTILLDIDGSLVKGDFNDVAIDLTFADRRLLEKVATFKSVRGAGYLLKEDVRVGNSLEVILPFLSRRHNILMAYDFREKLKAMKAFENAFMSELKDRLILTADTPELLVEVAGDWPSIRSVATSTIGPAGLFESLVFLGKDIYRYVRSIQKIDEKIHLTGWEMLTQLGRGLIGMDHSEYLDRLVEEKDGNNAAVQLAIELLKDSDSLQRYIFPSCAHVDGKLVSAPNSVVRLNNKVNNIMWSRNRPDDILGYGEDIFCKPKGYWETVPSAGTYYCENAIGVDYLKENGYALIDLGKGNDWAEGFSDFGNIFLIDRANKTLFGGNKDDIFFFNRKPYDDGFMEGFIDGGDGIDTIDAGGLYLKYQVFSVVVDFPSKSLKYSNNVVFHVNRINKYVGIPGVGDEVVLSCDTKFVDGKGGYEYHPDIYEIKNDHACVYSATIVVGSFTNVTNSAWKGEFKYFIHGEKGKRSHVFIEPTSKTRNLFIFKYKLADIAAIYISQSNSKQFSFVPYFYKELKKLSADNSFNITVNGSGEKSDYFLIDNTKIILGEKIVYALQNTEKPIGDIVEEYSNVVSNLGMYAVVHSHNDVLTITGRHNDILSNDPKARTNHFVGSAGENIVVFTSGQNQITMDKLPISETVIHYFNQHDAMDLDLLDLRKIVDQVRKDLRRDVKVEINNEDNDLILNLITNDESKQNVMKITLKNVLEYLWFRKIRIVMDGVFMIEDILGKFRLIPSPLNFNDKSDSVFVINPRDVVNEMKIKVGKELREYDYARIDDSLIITNSLHSNDYGNPSTVILNDFYNHSNFTYNMRSLTIEFDDMKIKLGDEGKRINDAQDFEKLIKEATAKSYESILNSIKRNQPLFKAIDERDFYKVKDIIDKNETILSSKDKWMNPLAYAAAEGNIGIVKYLVDKGADCTVKDGSGHIPAYYAVRYNRVEITNFLLPKLFAQGDEGMIALTSELTIVKYLNEVKSIYYTKTLMVHETSTLLHYAAMNGNMEVVKYIMEKAKKGLRGNLRAIDRFGQTPFYYAVKHHHGGVITYITEFLKKDGMTPLCFFAEIGNLEIVKYLVEEKKADVYEKNGSGATALHYAFKNLHRDVIEYLKQAIVREGEGQLLVYAIITDDIDMMETLIREKASVTSLNNKGKSPLHYAVNLGNLDMVQLLVENGADMHKPDLSGYPPVYYAHKKRVPAVRNYYYGVLLGRLFPEGTLTPADLDDEVFLNALTHSDVSVYNSERDYLNTLVSRLLVEKHVNINRRNNRGQSPLHYAARYGVMMFVQQFCQHGADVFLMDDEGRTAADYAAAANHKSVEEFLRNKMAWEKKHRKHREAPEKAGNAKRPRRSLGRLNPYSDENQVGLQHQYEFINSENSVSKLKDIPTIRQSTLGNDIFSKTKTAIGGVLGRNSENQTHPSLQDYSLVDAKGTIMLLDLLIRKVNGQKGVPTFATDESLLEVQGYALRVVDIFERVLNDTALELGISAITINFDPITLQTAIINSKRSGRPAEISKTLYSFATKACEGLEYTDKFLEHFTRNLNEAMIVENIVHNLNEQ